MKCTIFTTPPRDFSPTAQEASGCYLEHNDTLLFLKRSENCKSGNTWGIPGGKKEVGEDSLSCAVRELFEETGIVVDKDLVEEIGRLYIRYPHIDYIFNMFRTRVDEIPTINLRIEEHQEIKWVTVSEAIALPLIPGGIEALNCYLQFVREKQIFVCENYSTQQK